jgi:hypothetical protein
MTAAVTDGQAATALAVPPCEQHTDLPARNTRVCVGRISGVVHDADPRRGVLVLRDGAMFADWFAPEQVHVHADERNEDDGFGHHDADDALHDARREDELR